MPPPPSSRVPPRVKPSTVGDLLRARLREQREALQEAVESARRGDSEGIHDVRVALRRIRSALATHRRLLDRDESEPLRAELRWVAQELGRARDAEVVVEHVHRWLHEESGPIVGRAASSYTITAVEEHAERSSVSAREVFGSERYTEAIAALDRLLVDLPLTAKAERNAKKAARKGVKREARRVRRRLEAAYDEDDDEKRAALLHEVRKASKRLRYAAETGLLVSGRHKPVAAAAEQVQTFLGEHHDSVQTMRSMQLVAISQGDPAVALACGQVVGLEAVEMARFEDLAGDALDDLENDVANL